MTRKKNDKRVCPLCGLRKLEEYDICDCGWEREDMAEEDPEYSGGANHVCLKEAKVWYAQYGNHWVDEWWKQLKEHYGEDKVYEKWLNDETGWRPEPLKA